MSEIKFREKGQVTIPAELLQKWNKTNQVSINDVLEAQLANGVLMLIPKKRQQAQRSVMSYAGTGKGLWGQTDEEIDASIKEARNSWGR